MAKDFQVASASESGLKPDLGPSLDAGFQRGELAGLHALVVLRHGRIAFERYYEGIDETWGKPLGKVAFSPETQHDLRSASKSIVGLLYGIALAEGLVPGLDAPVLKAFGQYADLASDERRMAITMAHVLSMTMGLEWDESRPYTSAENSEIAMEMAADRYRYILERPIIAEPGTRWIYSGGATALLGHLIAKGAGKPLFEYAHEKLFSPLGITAVEWIKGSNGEEAAASGLRMRPRDLARIGQLLLDNGAYQGKQLVPVSWLAGSLSKHATIEQGFGYGYHWYLGTLRGSPRPLMGAYGNGGQRLFLVPSYDLVAVMMAGNYDRAGQSKLPASILNDFLIPALI